jgi:hypothetical protein
MGLGDGRIKGVVDQGSAGVEEGKQQLVLVTEEDGAEESDRMFTSSPEPESEHGPETKKVRYVLIFIIIALLIISFVLF